MWIRVILFLVINFLGLAIGGFFTGDGVPSEWYQQMNKAPWTPPGWVFGFAWTSIMITFSVYLALLYKKENRSVFILLYVAQVILNISWNPIFFYYRNTIFGLVIILALTALIYVYLISYFKALRWWSLLIIPYFVWINIATSLNAYVVIYN
ncbi:TspO/MBR family protein [Flammeovirga aprica]|uniref:Tryptophan-rich sensory protein n=1 Tax=Flammeovirga aprica JL-4 TaxID=694437 RepID=A0A7X9P237_9BACT|nr:TspO/MBR family protein [Flammeovirga aprica]NME67768.1 tryptophan-rich sensory protein [Flammeovirga aprica JL-4]